MDELDEMRKAEIRKLSNYESRFIKMVEIDKIKKLAEQKWQEYLDQKIKEIDHRLKDLDQEILKLQEQLGKK